MWVVVALFQTLISIRLSRFIMRFDFSGRDLQCNFVLSCVNYGRTRSVFGFWWRNLPNAKCLGINLVVTWLKLDWNLFLKCLKHDYGQWRDFFEIFDHHFGVIKGSIDLWKACFNWKQCRLVMIRNACPKSDQKSIEYQCRT